MMSAKIILSPRLSDVILRLESLPGLTNTVLRDILVEAGITNEDIEPFCYFNHPETESYGRLEIYRSNRIKVLVLSWNPGDFTAIHDHEPAEWGAVQFFGTISHRLYSVENNKLMLKQVGTVEAGQIAGVSGSLIHAMGCLSAEKAMTLHIYGTNTQFDPDFKTHVYDLEMERVVLTAGASFLTRNESDGIILSGKISADDETLADYVNNTLIWRNR